MGIDLNLECQKLGAMLNRMEELVHATWGDKRERLFKFCEGPGGIVTPSETVIGDEKRVPWEKIQGVSCGQKTQVGTFHTHPNWDIRPSMGDIMFHIVQGAGAFCIGGRGTRQIFSEEGIYNVIENHEKCYRIPWKKPEKVEKLRDYAKKGHVIEKSFLEDDGTGFEEKYEQYKPLITAAENLLEMCHMIDSGLGMVRRVVGSKRRFE